jgi:hypothetical protein
MITKGEMVLYTLSGDDAEIDIWPRGAQAHIGNAAKEGAQYAAMVVEDWKQHGEASGAGVPDNPGVNLQVFLDGNDVFWATSRKEDGSKSPAPGTWQRRA